MKQKLEKNAGGFSRFLGQLATEKKKEILAFCLISVMAFMWMRVLGSKGPDATQAAIRAANTGFESESEQKVRISFVELPDIKGRNDALCRDFFELNQKRFSGTRVSKAVSGDGKKESIERIGNKLKLEAIGLSENPQAFINEKLLSIGDTLIVPDGMTMYECEIVGIEKTKVFVRFGEEQIILELKDDINTGD